MPKLIGIATHTHTKGPIIQHQSMLLHLKTGLENDYLGCCNPRRQVTLLSAKTWNNICKNLGTTLDWSKRRADLLVDDMDFSEGKALIGQQIQVGTSITPNYSRNRSLFTNGSTLRRPKKSTYPQTGQVVFAVKYSKKALFKLVITFNW
ncbi:hypothetical protein MNBD_GAMMA03-346 [hydrothermal vent metagenome]|uniref:Uncharacterized protein n=1 Tax=hydrothermal vent metagenome TaxID=652676 RepID=A0A3B0W2R2_9ZZZZ